MVNKEGEEVDAWKERIQDKVSQLIQSQEIIKNEQSTIKGTLHQLEISDKLQDNEIDFLKQVLNEIKDDTNWIKRKITGAIITGIIGLVITGLGGIFIASL